MTGQNNYGIKLYCSPDLWCETVKEEAALSQCDHVRVLAGSRSVTYIRPRWRAIKRLVSAGYSYNSIAKASGFDHTTVRHAHLADRPAFPNRLTIPKKIRGKVQDAPMPRRDLLAERLAMGAR